MKRLVWLLSLSLLVPSVSGCTAELRINYDPDSVTLAASETAPPPKITTSGYSVPNRTIEIVEWTVQDPEIASVDADTGVITGVAPGETRVVGYEQEGFRNAFGFPVTVTAYTTATR